LIGSDIALYQQTLLNYTKVVKYRAVTSS